MTRTYTHLRWLIRRDMPSVLEIENNSFEFPWSHLEFVRFLRTPGNIGMVAEIDDEVVGYMVYELRRREIELLSFAVHPKYRQNGIGRTLIERLIYKLDFAHRERIIAEVREKNLQAQLFLRGMGFLCTQVLRDHYEDSTEDAYLMEYFVCNA